MIEVTAIKLPTEFEIYKNTEGESLEFLEPVSKINIFVGSNNSGKSRFVRSLSKLIEYEVKQENIDLIEINSKLLHVIDDIANKMALKGIKKIDSVIDNNTIESFRSLLNGLINLGNDRFEPIKQVFDRLSTKTPNQIIVISEDYDWVRYFQYHILDQAKRISTLLKEIPFQSESNTPKKIYIPTLRGLRPLDETHTDFYLQRTRKDYFEHQIDGEASNLENIERKRPEVFTGLSLYQRITDLLLGNNSERKLISHYQDFISEKLFEGKPVALIPSQKEKVVIVKIGNEKEQPIHHLGDGIQSAIILSFLPFVMQEQTFFFIEEPEMYLHPGLQRKILEFYNSLERHTFFMTTHSNHFLDITIDIKNVSIFTFRKILGESEDEELTPNFTIEAVDSTHESSLELLGVRNSSVFLVNATIWVEGITDRFYFRKMLSSYMDYLSTLNKLPLRLEEDTHYSFVEYGGSNITHWTFLESDNPQIEVKNLCAKALVIIDKDGTSKMERKEGLRKKMKKYLIELPCQEVENLLPYQIIKEIVLSYEEKSKTLPEFNFDDYKDVYLGEFIEDKMLGGKHSRKGGYKEDSGTIKSKKSFCEKALDKIEYQILPSDTKKIVKQIYDFIYERNSK